MSLRVLLIGVHEYMDPLLPSMDGAVADLNLWFGYFRFRLGVPDAEIRVLGSVSPNMLLGQLANRPGPQPNIDIRPPTRADILEGFTWLMEGIDKGQRGLLSYSGYGTLLPPAKRPRGVRPAARVRAICPMDIAFSSPKPNKDDDSRGPARVLVEGAIPLPDHSLRGVPIPAGHALDRALDPQGQAHHRLTVVLDTSFTTFTQPPRAPSRSLPVITERAPCLPVYALASRTLCSARPGEEAADANLFGPSIGTIAFPVAYALRNTYDTEGLDDGGYYSKVSHQTLLDSVRDFCADLGMPQRPTLSGISSAPLLSFLSPGPGCGFRDGDRHSRTALDRYDQIHGGVDGFRGYTIEGEILPAAGGAPSWVTIGYILSTGAPVFGARVGSQPTLWPRPYEGQKEYWRTIDGAVEDLFAAKQQQRLLAVRITFNEQRTWDEAPSSTAVKWVRDTAEGNTRKRHCDVYPAWNSAAHVPLDGPHQIVLQATLNGDDVCVCLCQDPAQPTVLKRVVWYHGRPQQHPFPTFFAQLPPTGRSFAIVPGDRPPPHGRATWWCADTKLEKLPSDP